MAAPARNRTPGLALLAHDRALGQRFVAGVDEAGRGALAGPLVAAAVLLVTILGRESELSAWGAQIYFWARLAYVPVYAAGIPGLRSAIWTVSLVGLLLVLASIAF